MRKHWILQVTCGAGLTLFAMGAEALLCDIVIDRTGMVVYQDIVPPVDMSPRGAAARDRMRERGEQLMVIEAEQCPRLVFFDHRQFCHPRRNRGEHAPVCRRNRRNGRQCAARRQRHDPRSAGGADPHQRLRAILLTGAYVAPAPAGATVRALGQDSYLNDNATRAR